MTRAIRTLLILLALNFAPVPVAADIIVPSSLVNVEGNANNGFPFNILDHGRTSMRYQQVYLASEFGPDALNIEAMLFRPDGGNGGSGNPFSTVLPNAQINLSTTPNGPDGLSSTFADNVGLDDTNVHAGSLALSSADAAGPGNTRAFDIIIPFTTPFFYNPALGNLLLDVRVVGGLSTQFDANETFGDSVSRVFSDDSAASTGIPDTLGLVTKFQTSPVNAVPDPASSMSLLMMGFSGLFAARRWTKSN